MMEPSFEKLLVLLADAEVDFIVVGGIAVSNQGYVRLTDARKLPPADFTDTEGAIRIVAGDSFQASCFHASTTAPATMSRPPTRCCGVIFSFRKMAARMITKTTPSLSTGATRDASPSCRARK